MQTLNQFAWQLGANLRITLEHSTGWHKAFVRADKATQATWRREFVANFVAGNLDISADKAEKIVSLKRVERTETQEKAVNAASKKFAYHIVRATPQRKEAVRVRIAQSERNAWEKFVSIVGEDRAVLIAKTLG